MDQVAKYITRGCREVGVELPEACLHGVGAYLQLLQKWNARINLVGTKDPQQIVDQHLVDCLAVLPHIPEEGGSLVDVGSGAGLPGALIALVRRDVEVIALEPVRKKHSFMATVRRELGLDNFKPRPLRMEEHLQKSGERLHDVAVSRAAFALSEWFERAHSLVRPGGVILGMEGRERQVLPEGAGRHSYRLGDRTRAIISLVAS